MSDIIITVTEAARNFADGVNRAHYQNQTFVLLKNGVPFAQLVPAGKQACRGRELADAVTSAALSDKEAAAFSRDLQAARRTLNG